MPNIKSAKKRLKQNIIRRDRNRSIKTRMRTFLKKAETAIDAGDLEKAKTAVQEACQVLDKTAQKGVVHANMASRKKSRLMSKLNKMSS